MRYYIEQRSREWFELRLGIVTSTRLKIVAHGTLAAQTKLLDTMQWELDRPEAAIEKYMVGFGHATPRAIRLGREREDWLIARYEIILQQRGDHPRIDRPGFVRHSTIKEFGSSPDWLNLDGSMCVGEGKVRLDQAKHEFALARGLLPEDKDQIYCHMMCAGMTNGDYVSYCPEYPDTDRRICITHVTMEQIYTNFLYAELHRFLKHFRAGTRPTVPKGGSAVPSFFDEE